MGRARDVSVVAPASGLRGRLRRRPDGANSLLARCRADPNEFLAFYDAYSERVLRYHARRLLDAETALDLTSETFAKALQRCRQFRGSTPEAEQAWLFAIASSELSHYWRHGKAERKALQRLDVTAPELTDHDLERIEELAGIQDIAPQLAEELHALPDDQRRAVELRIVSELSYEEIAQEVGTSAQAVRARVSRGLRTLAEGMHERGIDRDGEP